MNVPHLCVTCVLPNRPRSHGRRPSLTGSLHGGRLVYRTRVLPPRSVRRPDEKGQEPPSWLPTAARSRSARQPSSLLGRGCSTRRTITRSAISGCARHGGRRTASTTRRRTPSFVCERPLRVGPAEEHILQTRLKYPDRCIMPAWAKPSGAGFLSGNPGPTSMPGHYPARPRSGRKRSRRHERPMASLMLTCRPLPRSAATSPTGSRSTWMRRSRRSWLPVRTGP